MNFNLPCTSNQVDDLLDENGAFKNFNDYMYAKAMKLLHQANDNVQLNSKLFEGLSIYVNGYTEPPAIYLREIFVANGGNYHHYMRKSTNYIIASSIAAGKWKAVAQYTILYPSWVVDSAQKNTVLPIEEYRVKPEEVIEPSVSSTSVETFYEHSRLHLISTLSNEMKELVCNLRSTLGTRTFVSRPKLLHLVEETFDESKIESAIVHVDMDCFFVSVALKTRPHFRGQPVAITHSRKPGIQGHAEIASCSYEARKYNIRNGMWVNEAVQRCPNLICLPYEFDKYRMMSNVFYSIIARYTLDIKAVSCDELYIDLTTLCKQMKITAIDQVVRVIRLEIFTETGCSASAGMGPNMVVARLATRLAKPNGQFLVNKAGVKNFIKDFQIKDVPGVGYSAMGKIQTAFSGAKTCSDLHHVPLSQLQSLLGRINGKKIYNAVRGEAEGGLNLIDGAERKSVSCDVNFGIRLSTQLSLQNLLSDIAHNLSKKLTDSGLSTSSITVKLLIRAKGAPIEPAKYGAHGECDQMSKSATLTSSTNLPEIILEQCLLLITALSPVLADIRGISVQGTKIIKCGEGYYPRSRHQSREVLKKLFGCPSSALLNPLPLPTYSDRDQPIEECIDKKLLLYLPTAINFEAKFHTKLDKLLRRDCRKLVHSKKSRKMRCFIDQLIDAEEHRTMRMSLQQLIRRNSLKCRGNSIEQSVLFMQFLKIYTNFLCQLRHRIRPLPVKNLSFQF